MSKNINKSSKIKNIIKNNDINLNDFIKNKINYVQEIIRNTIISIKINKEIFSNNDIILSISILSELYGNTKEINKKHDLILNEKTVINNKKNEQSKMIEELQEIINKLLMIISGFGTKNIEDLLYIIFDKEFNNIKFENELFESKFELIKKHIHPLGCKIIQWKNQKNINYKTDDICINKITEDNIVIENANSFECFDTDKYTNTFYQKINGIRVIIHSELEKKTIIINGIIDNIEIDCFSNFYIEKRKQEIKELANDYEDIEKDIILRILDSFHLKDILIYGNEDLTKKMIAVITETNLVKQSKLDNTIKKFLDLDAYSQRNILINLLFYNNDDEINYLCYILYDLINLNFSNENNEQQFIFESLPFKIKKYFKDVVKFTTKYTNDMMQKYDLHKITLEQQIYLLNANDIIKEKAIIKLKEVKSKTDETGLKAKQYLEGLLKIPFNVYKEEPILKKIKEINKYYSKMILVLQQLFKDFYIECIIKKERYSIIEIFNNIKKIELFLDKNINNYIKNTINTQTYKQVLNIIYHINTIKKSKKEIKFSTVNKKKDEFIIDIFNYLNENNNNNLISDIFDIVHTEIPFSLNKIFLEITNIKSNIQQIDTTISLIENTLDDSIYSHKHAKNQIVKIIAQWMNGEQSGYCFGFEGCPGIGKTSLAKKGLANCLKDENGISRPFAFIALGGSSNGSFLEGHGYTYMNSSWGKIIDILIDTKCMNPIIYIDELDKVSKTENGKEIIGIFTHLIDQTQNDKFQDKYFSGIDIDLSKALFIFSYNDPEQIDRVLLDRIHRIKFDNLTLNDKMVIVNKYIIPEINKKMGFENIVNISNEMIEFIINEYTLEPGVRKLKEIFFDLFGEINLSLLKTNKYSDENNLEQIDIPIVVTKENIENKYLLKYNKINIKKIHLNPEIGIINGLWANSLGKGGIIPIQTIFFPTSIFLELKLTGLQGDVMKESMNVAKSLAWNLTNNKIKNDWIKYFEETKEQGIHIHCPEGSISKDGPSAGSGITIAIYSLLNNKPIKNNIAITGEISLSGEITAIGGLEYKILGGIQAGIKTFIYPKENNKDFNEWKKNDDNESKCKEICFIEVSNIQEVLKHVFI
jgi:hypothetical protein